MWSHSPFQTFLLFSARTVRLRHFSAVVRIDAGGYAIRFAGKNVVEVFDDEGKLLETVSLEETEKKGAA